MDECGHTEKSAKLPSGNKFSRWRPFFSGVLDVYIWLLLDDSLSSDFGFDDSSFVGSERHFPKLLYLKICSISYLPKGIAKAEEVLSRCTLLAYFAKAEKLIN